MNYRGGRQKYMHHSVVLGVYMDGWSFGWEVRIAKKTCINVECVQMDKSS